MATIRQTALRLLKAGKPLYTDLLMHEARCGELHARETLERLRVERRARCIVNERGHWVTVANG
jgi:hypothetical protein